MIDASSGRSVRRRPPIRRLSAIAFLGALLLIAESSVAVATVAAAKPPEPPAGAVHPTIHYEEALAHAHDRVSFPAGGRVSVEFTPRPGDHWPVGGVSPRGLPSGKLDGKSMRDRQDATPTAPSSVLDEPATEPGTAAPADPAVFLPSSEAPAYEPAAAITPAGLRREIFGFLPYWEVSDSTTVLDYTKLSTIAFFGVGASGTGTLQTKNSDGTLTPGWSGWTSAKMTSVINAAHQGHTRVVLTVQSFGWSTTGLTRQKQLLGSATNRLNLAKQIVSAVRNRGADGVNLDFEPLASGYAEEFTALVRTVRAEFDKVARGYQITFDTTGWLGNYPIAAATAAGGADAVFIMGYDYRTASASKAGSIAPIGGPAYDIRETLDSYLAQVPASKLILGVPYYGRAWSTDSSGLNANNTSGTKFGASTTVLYDTAADYLAKYGKRWDPVEGVAWTVYTRENCTTTYGCVNSWRQLYVDDAQALRAKYDLVNSNGLRGAGIWALGYDGTRPDLWKAIQDKFVTDLVPPVVGIKRISNRVVNPAFSVSWTGTDDSAIATYDVQVSTDGGPWTTWRSSTTATSGTYPGVDGRTYAFRIRGRDVKGNLGAWKITTTYDPTPALVAGGFGVVRTDGLALRTGPDTTAARIVSLNLSELVAVTGSPRDADGYTWYPVTGPIYEWGTVSRVYSGWVAAQSSTTTFVAPAPIPNGTRVDAVIGELAFGSTGADSIGTTAGATAARAFSPNGDGLRDTLRISWTNALALDTLELRVFRPDGSLVTTVPLSQRSVGGQVYDWNGKVGATRVADGRYLIALTGTADGKNYSNPSQTLLAASQLDTFGATVDTVAPAVSSASVGGSLVSPNGDGRLDTVAASVRATGGVSWGATVAPLSGSTAGPAVRTAGGSGSIAAFTWDGRDDDGHVVADGSYRLTAWVGDAAGNRASRAWTIRVDTTPATLASSGNTSAIDPAGIGHPKTIALRWATNEPIAGRASILKGTTTVRSWSIAAGTSGVYTWDGRDASGALVGDGRYTFRVSGRDAAGNPSSRDLSVGVDRTITAAGWSGAFFPQDGDTLARTSTFNFSVRRAATVTLRIYQGSTLVRTVRTGQLLAAGSYRWAWDGRGDGGGFLAQGRYTGVLTAVSSFGLAGTRRTVAATGFETSLSATTVRAGQTLTLNFRTVEPIRSSPRVSFTQVGRLATTKTATPLGSGRYRVTFAVRSGAPGTAVIRIRATDQYGHTNGTNLTVLVR
ncbi:MAG: glycosyl hydrolase family 18 protein [Chloroflexota bacterium]